MDYIPTSKKVRQREEKKKSEKLKQIWDRYMTQATMYTQKQKVNLFSKV